MRRTRTTLAGLAASALLAGCWVQPGFDAGRGNWNPDPTITPANVGELVELWEHDTGDLPVLAPLSVNRRIFAGVSDPSGSHEAVALDAVTGAVVWENERESQGTTMYTPVYLGGNILLPISQLRFGQAVKVSAATGEDAGSISTRGVWSLAVAGGELVVADFNYSSTIPSFIAYSIEWQYDAVITYTSDDPLAPSSHFALVDDRILWAYDTTAVGYAPCGAAQCPAAWTTELGGKPIGLAKVDSGFAAYTLDTGAVTVVDVLTGAIRWTTDAGAGTPPAVASSKIVVGTDDNRLVTLEAASGAPLWEAALPGPASRPLVGGEVVYVEAGGDLLAFPLGGCEAASCEPIARLEIGASASGGPIVDSGRVIVGTSDGRIVAFGHPPQSP